MWALAEQLWRGEVQIGAVLGVFLWVILGYFGSVNLDGFGGCFLGVFGDAKKKEGGVLQKRKRSLLKKKAQFVETKSAVIFTRLLTLLASPLQQRDCGRSRLLPQIRPFFTPKITSLLPHFSPQKNTRNFGQKSAPFSPPNFRDKTQLVFTPSRSVFFLLLSVLFLGAALSQKKCYLGLVTFYPPYLLPRNPLPTLHTKTSRFRALLGSLPSMIFSFMCLCAFFQKLEASVLIYIMYCRRVFLGGALGKRG